MDTPIHWPRMRWRYLWRLGVALPIALCACQDAPPCTSQPAPNQQRVADTAPVESQPPWFAATAIPTDPSKYPYNHVAGITEMPNGDLLVVWVAGSAEAAKDTVIVASRRMKGQAAWSNPSVVANNPEASVANPTLFVDDRGVAWLFHVELLEEGNLCASRIVVQTSGDSGQTWSASRQAYDQLCTLIKNKPIITQGGAWILPAYQQAIYQSQFLFSVDRGQTWEATSPLLTLPDNNLQPALVQLSDGSLYALMRSSAESGFTWEGRSTSCGKSWSLTERRDLPNPGSGIDLIQLADGRLLLAFNPDSQERTPIAVAVSEDDGQTWSSPKNIETGPPQLSYPSVIQAHNGAIYIVYSHRLAFIQFAEFNAAWLSASQ